MNSYLDFVPHHLPVRIEPFQEELLSSWLLRTASANAVSMEELIKAAGVHSDYNVIVESRAVCRAALYDRNGLGLLSRVSGQLVQMSLY